MMHNRNENTETSTAAVFQNCHSEVPQVQGQEKAKIRMCKDRL